MDNIILKKKITELKEDQILNYLNLIQRKTEHYY